jgi:hypothetical protein
MPINSIGKCRAPDEGTILLSGLPDCAREQSSKVCPTRIAAL